MATPYNKDFNKTNSGKIALEYSAEKVADWIENGTPSKTWKTVRNQILGLLEDGIPNTQGIYDLLAQEQKLKLKAQELNDKRFVTKVIRSGLKHNNPVIMKMIPENIKKELAPDIKSNS